MAVDNPPPPDSATSIAAAIADVSEKAQLLIREEIELAKAEVEMKVKSLVRGAVVGIAGGVFALLGLFYLLDGLAWLAYYVLPTPNQTYFWGFFVVAGVLFLMGGLAGFFAAKLFKKGTPPQPQMAIDEARLIKATVDEARAAETKR